MAGHDRRVLVEELEVAVLALEAEVGMGGHHDSYRDLLALLIIRHGQIHVGCCLESCRELSRSDATWWQASQRLDDLRSEIRYLLRRRSPSSSSSALLLPWTLPSRECWSSDTEDTAEERGGPSSLKKPAPKPAACLSPK